MGQGRLESVPLLCERLENMRTRSAYRDDGSETLGHPGEMTAVINPYLYAIGFSGGELGTFLPHSLSQSSKFRSLLFHNTFVRIQSFGELWIIGYLSLGVLNHSFRRLIIGRECRLRARGVIQQFLETSFGESRQVARRSPQSFDVVLRQHLLVFKKSGGIKRVLAGFYARSGKLTATISTLVPCRGPLAGVRRTPSEPKGERVVVDVWLTALAPSRWFSGEPLPASWDTPRFDESVRQR